MSRDLNYLEKTFKKRVETLLDECEKEGFSMVPYRTWRSPETQAKLWRQSRPTWKINQRIEKLESLGFFRPAQALRFVGPSSGPHVTNAIPGMSWHQFGEAVDCYWNIDGNAIWSVERKENGKNGYDVYAQIAKDLGLNSGHLWKNFQDSPHVQLSTLSNPLKRYQELGILKYEYLNNKLVDYEKTILQKRSSK